MDRRDKIISKCNLNGAGLEIGPSINPVVPKCDGYNIETIDHTDKKGLIEKYSSHGINLDKIEEVDYVWNGESYKELTGKINHYDYIIASHVIEHTCDLIAFLCDCSELLNENGVLSLVIPDKRFCYDYFRPVTCISQVIDRHLSKCTFNSPGSVYDYYSSVCFCGDNLAWEGLHPPFDVGLAYDTSDAKEAYLEVLNNEKYIDIHNWVFTKNSFELIIHNLNCLDLIDLVVAESFDTKGHEFYVSLVKRDVPFQSSKEERLRLTLNAKNELEPGEPDKYSTEKINGLKEYIDKQYETIKEQKEQIAAQNEQIENIYKSKTYKTGEKIQKIYRKFVPGKIR
ncbi:MAG: hypothetical protein FWD38_01130 [Oscillospiraceae bacterium]|nr:hypothetical protein [Oscillospiraceae bacterium]